MEFEDLLVQIGDYGWYQKRLTLVFLAPSAALLPCFFMNVLFMVSVPDHWCHVPELDAWNLTLEQQHLLIRPPNDPKCSMYRLNYTELFESPNWNWTVPENTTTTKCQYGYLYDKSNYERTAATTWDLVCEDSHYVSLVLTLASVGSIFGTPVYGYLSDKYGRKYTFYLTAIVTLVSGIVSILMTNFAAFVVMRTINGSIMPSVFQVPFIILLEIVGPTMRTRMNGVANTCWTVGLCFMPLLAWLCRDWVLFGVVTSSAAAIFFAYWKVLPESPRWLTSQERFEDAADVMADIARVNGKLTTREDILIQLKKLGEHTKEEEEKMKKKANDVSAVDILKHSQLRKYFFILTFCWVACGAAYYGLQINAPNLGGNEFVTFFLLAVVEIPGFAFSWFFMQKWGRRWCSVFTIILTGVALLVPVFEPNAGVTPSLIGKFGSSAGFMVMYQQSSELYPTVLRAIGLGLICTVYELITIGVPYIIYLAEFGKFIPFLIISIICILAGSSASLLPETLNENLPQTIKDTEVFAENQRFCTCTRRRRPSCYENRPSFTKELNNFEITKTNGQNSDNTCTSVVCASEGVSHTETKHNGSRDAAGGTVLAGEVDRHEPDEARPQDVMGEANTLYPDLRKDGPSEVIEARNVCNEP